MFRIDNPYSNFLFYSKYIFTNPHNHTNLIARKPFYMIAESIVCRIVYNYAIRASNIHFVG